ncbi:MAG: riboflavin synthase [Candidatus Liptonbacteria bacterium]|nr:riboflavin synthase [Candidatus Liptonbacteria bacterium]
MFTGIIAALGKVRDASARGGSVYVLIQKPAGWKVKKGESISVDGICSTVKGLRGNSFEVEYMPETVKKTAAKLLKKGMCVNMERSLRLNDRLDGHLVQGHVDTTGDIREIGKIGNSVILKIGFPGRYRKFIAEKGSISVNGVSLTVVAGGGNWFTVSLVSYTLEHTNLRNLKKGDKVNLETDVLARYLQAPRSNREYR